MDGFRQQAADVKDRGGMKGDVTVRVTIKYGKDKFECNIDSAFVPNQIERCEMR